MLQCGIVSLGIMLRCNNRMVLCNMILVAAHKEPDKRKPLAIAGAGVEFTEEQSKAGYAALLALSKPFVSSMFWNVGWNLDVGLSITSAMMQRL